jgi:hypothetical protein
MSEASYHRLIIRFTNGETVKFVLREPVDTSRISMSSQFVLVRSSEEGAEGPGQIFLASLKDVSYLKVEPLSAKDLRHRVTGMAAGSVDESSGPDAVSTVEFI